MLQENLIVALLIFCLINLNNACRAPGLNASNTSAAGNKTAGAYNATNIVVPVTQQQQPKLQAQSNALKRSLLQINAPAPGLAILANQRLNTQDDYEEEKEKEYDYSDDTPGR